MRKPECIVAPLCAFLALIFISAHANTQLELLDREKEAELKGIREFIAKASGRIKAASSLRARDFLLLLPDVTLSRRSPYEEAPAAETYLSVSFRAGNLFQMEERRRGRETDISKGLAAARSAGFRMEKLLEKKHLHRKRIWKMEMIRRSLEGPLEAAEMDGKIDRERILYQDACIDLEKVRAEVEGMVREVER